MDNMSYSTVIEKALLTKSSYIDLSGLKLSMVPQELCNLKDLEIINLNNNSILDIKPLLLLENVRIIDLRNNRISCIDEDFLKFGLPIKEGFDYADEGLYIGNNPIENIPAEVLSQGNTAIESYLNAIKDTLVRYIIDSFRFNFPISINLIYTT
jgi:Leucine-rich repeat (LRR) protein